MADSIGNKLECKVHEVKGAVKEMVGRATDNSELEAEGQAERIAGKIQM
jgi:uncharacterized protein YjbJ (UPF0337 family)